MSRQKGFTLIELVVVVMILGILAAVAAPKLLNTSATATENGARQTLSVIRDAIERYMAEQGSLPADPSTDLIAEELIRAPFPACPVGANKGDASVAVVAGAVSPTGTEGWMYSTLTGDFIINEAPYSTW